MTRRTLTRLAIDLDPLIAGVIEERGEEDGKGPVPVVCGGYRDGGDDTYRQRASTKIKRHRKPPAKTPEKRLEMTMDLDRCRTSESSHCR